MRRNIEDTYLAIGLPCNHLYLSKTDLNGLA